VKSKRLNYEQEIKQIQDNFPTISCLPPLWRELTWIEIKLCGLNHRKKIKADHCQAIPRKLIQKK